MHGTINSAVDAISAKRTLDYSWIGRPVQTYTKLICREIERTTTNLNIRMKSFRRGASNGADKNFASSFFGELFLKK